MKTILKVIGVIVYRTTNNVLSRHRRLRINYLCHRYLRHHPSYL